MSTEPAPYAPTDAQIAQIAADLRDDGVYVDPSLASQVSAKEEAAIVKAADGADVPIYVVAAPVQYRGDPSTPAQMATLVHDVLDRDGVYLVSSVSAGLGTYTTESTAWGVAVDDAYASLVANELYEADLGRQLQEATELIATQQGRQKYEELGLDERYSGSSTSDGEPGDGPDSTVVVSIGVVAAVVVVGVVLARALRRRRDGKGIKVTGRALQRISREQARGWRDRARTETDLLGERIRATEIDDAADGAAWSAALDHYDAASRVLEREHRDVEAGAADSIGALVLARRGADALEHAVAGTPWTPTVACFFDPLHGPGTTTVEWRTAAGARDVPACTPCARTVRKDREPDFLDLPTGDTVVHYVDSGKEPWASTGFGSLDPDLLDRV